MTANSFYLFYETIFQFFCDPSCFTIAITIVLYLLQKKLNESFSIQFYLTNTITLFFQTFFYYCIMHVNCTFLKFRQKYFEKGCIKL